MNEYEMTANTILSAIIIFIFLLKGTNSEGPVPDYLIECYNDSTTLLPMTIENFIAIIKSIEEYPNAVMDINTLVNTIILRFWEDGIILDRNIIVLQPEVIPFRINSFQTYKSNLLKHTMIPRSRNYFFQDQMLTASERCTLHNMISTSVDIWERGNEFDVCKNYFVDEITKTNSGFRKSSCPIEKGVVSTRYFGTVSLSHVLLALSSALQPMNVPLMYFSRDGKFDENGVIEKKWTPITGDLAEILIIQSPMVKEDYIFGPSGKWNDTGLPTEYYMTLSEDSLHKEFWQFTDAEILGAIDGLIMADEVEKWMSGNKLLRLSQIVEAFYSNKYKSLTIRAHVCKRKEFFHKLIANNRMAKQVENFADVLAQYIPNYLRNDSVFLSRSKTLVNKFYYYVSNLLQMPTGCPEEVLIKTKLTINLVIDNSWASYDVMKFLMILGENVEVSTFGSKLSLIAGDSGTLLADSLESLGDIYHGWYNNTVNGISKLPRSLLTIQQNMKIDPGNSTNVEAFSHVNIVLAMTTILDENDIVESMELLKSIRQTDPDMIFVYITSVPLAPMYVKLTSAMGSQDDEIIAVENHSVLKTLQKLSFINNVPKAIRPVVCDFSWYRSSSVELREFANPGVILFYRIHPYYLCRTDFISIEIFNEDKGNVVGCVFRDSASSTDEDCKEASLNENIIFKIYNPCPSKMIYETNQNWNEECKPVYIRIYGKRSLTKCTDKLCSMPDDIPFSLRVNGLKCVGALYTTCSANINQANTLLCIYIIIVIKYVSFLLYR